MMKKILLLGVVSLFISTCYAQDGYTISGRIRGINTDKIYLVAADVASTDTLASASVENDAFLLQGNVEGGVRAVNLLLAGIEGSIPLLLEHITYQVSVTPQGAMIEGEGSAARLYKEFGRIVQAYVTTKNSIEQELQTAGKVSDAKIQSLQTRLDNAYRESVDKTLSLIKANSDSYISAYVIALGSGGETEALLRAKYNLLGTLAQKTIPGKAVAAALERYKNLVKGKEAPDLVLEKPDGSTFTLHGISAKWKLLHFWSSENMASRQVNSELVRLYLQYRPKGLEIVSVALDTDNSAWRKAVGMDGLMWTNGSDLKDVAVSEAARLYLVGELPAFFLLDGENKIIVHTLSLSDIQAELAELTKRKKKK